MPDDTVLLERHFNTAFAAPDGIQKLRELILTLAMQGKLVPQDPTDQPASELLKAIEVERQQLIAEKQIRVTRLLPKIKVEDVPYTLPKGWEWVQLGNIATLENGDRSNRYPNENDHQESGIPFFGAKDMVNGVLRFNNGLRFISEAKFSELTNGKLIDRDFVVLLRGTVGKIAIFRVTAEFSTGFINAQMLIVRMLNKELCNFFSLYSSSIFFQSLIAIKTTGSAIRQMPANVLLDFLVPLPPLAEQHRIVAKIDRLMARCDELETLRADRNQKRITIHTAALDRLLTAKESSDFSTAWRFITQYFGELYSVKENVAELRKAILQLAVMGKLVPQDPTDEPASELLKAIEAEKQRLVKEGKIKQSKPLPEIKPQQVPYELPKGWNWVRLGDISQIIGGFAYKSNLFKTEGTRQVLRLGNIRPDLIRLNENPVFIDDSLGELTSELCLLKNDILITMTGTRSKHDYLYTVRVEENPMNGVLLYLNQRVGAIRLFSDARYMNLALKVEILKDAIFSSATGSANQANIGINNLREWIVPLPPLTEQHRIIAKTDRIMALCDQLDEQIDAATSKQTTLLNAVMTQV